MSTSEAPFQLVSPFAPAGDQPTAIEALVRGLQNNTKHQVLLGVTGSGKTFTMANVIQHVQRPTLILSHNKTLAAQLYSEFRDFFPHNAVHYFVSYYDYYQPEAYIPARDVYIEKDSSINEEIDRLRLAATSALVSRRDVIIVASVSSIYGLGNPEDYKNMVVPLKVGQTINRDDIEQISITNPLTGEVITRMDEIFIYPAKHFVTPEDRIERAIVEIREELRQQLAKFEAQGKLLEAQRLNARTRFDLEMLQEVGHCPGVENYSRPLSGKPPGASPDTLYDFFPEDFLLMVDESHVTVPQVRAMYAGDRSRKTTLVEHGFRLPSALDNRPLMFDEWEQKTNQVIFVSATPSHYELEKTAGEVVEQVIRPTGLLDPEIEVVAARGQVAHLLEEVRVRATRNERTLVTALTKRLAEDLAGYLTEQNVRCRWLHSELDAFERVELLYDLRHGKFDCLVGVNLLREGLDLPEVSLVAILDADKEGFLRSETSLIQTIGRAARNVNSKVVLYADKMTAAMQAAIGETLRRRKLQEEYNALHGITPQSVAREIKAGINSAAKSHQQARAAVRGQSGQQIVTEAYLELLEKEMLQAAEDLEFERAAALRDKVVSLRDHVGESAEDYINTSQQPSGPRRRGKSNSRVPRPKK